MAAFLMITSLGGLLPPDAEATRGSKVRPLIIAPLFAAAVLGVPVCRHARRALRFGGRRAEGAASRAAPLPAPTSGSVDAGAGDGVGNGAPQSGPSADARTAEDEGALAELQ